MTTTMSSAGLCVVVCLLLLGGCAPKASRPSARSDAPASQSAGKSATDSAPNGPAEAVPCAVWACHPEPAIALIDGYAVRLWASAQPDPAKPTSLASTPVVELLKNSKHVQWWVAEQGFGWEAQLTCLTTGPLPNCMVLADVGAHAGVAEMLLLQSGALQSPPRTHVVFDSGAPSAADLNGDGYLDLVGSNSDFSPGFATGHNFWVTYRFVTDSMTETGCSPRNSASERRPDQLLSGHCPAPPVD
ncbi:hypothetical protein ACSMXN_08135 [Jatrophihabitans sp. DSM 45814]